jgi:death-on-curing protein
MTAANHAWRWLPREVLIAVHEEQLAEHGGAPGLRDEGLFESALARPQQLANYGEPDVVDLAAASAFGLVRNHPFIDGNKRTGFVAAQLFLRLNGHRIGAPLSECVLTTLALAAGDLDEAAFAAWLRRHLQAL